MIIKHHILHFYLQFLSCLNLTCYNPLQCNFMKRPNWTSILTFHIHCINSLSQVYFEPLHTFWCILLKDLIPRAFSIMNLIHVGFQNLRLTLFRNLICILLTSKYSSTCILIYALAIHYFQRGPTILQTLQPYLLWQHIWKQCLIPFPHCIIQQMPAWILATQCCGIQNAVYYH